MRIGSKVEVRIDYGRWEEGLVLMKGKVERSQNTSPRRVRHSFTDHRKSLGRRSQEYAVYIPSSHDIMDCSREDLNFIENMSKEEILTYGGDDCLVELVKTITEKEEEEEC